MPFGSFSRLLLVLLCSAGPVAAHEFSVLLVTPAGVTSAAIYNAFRLASRERDGHADELSDGHLGGLDVYIGQADHGADLKTALIENTLDVVVLLETPGPTLVQSFQDTDAVLVEVAAITEKMKQDFLLDFTPRYQIEFGTAPLAEALQSYVAARLIDLAVRPRDGVADRTFWQQVLGRYQ